MIYLNVFEWSESAVFRVLILPIVVVPFCVFLRVLCILLIYIKISSPSVQYVTAFPVVKSAPNWQRHHTNGTPDAAIVLLIPERHLQSDCPVCCSRSSGGDGGGSFNRLSRHVVLIVTEGATKPEDQSRPGTRALWKDSSKISISCVVIG